MTPTTRWKLVSVLLAGCMSYSWWHGEAASTPTAAAHKRLTGPLRVSASALGISTDELVRKLFTTKDVVELEELAERLGVVGDDAVIDAVLPLVHDPRCRIQTSLVRAFGAIGTDHAVDVLLALVADPRADLRVAAVDALGTTANDRAVATLARLAGRPDGDVGSAAMRALGRIDTPAARTALVALVDSPSLAVASSAISELTARDLDPDLVAKLTSIVRAGERDLVGAALGALAKAGEPGIAVVREAALDGPLDVRITAMTILGDSDSPHAVDTLRTILDTEQGRAADAAANVLSAIDSDDAREALISAALADEDSGTRAVEYLLRQQGPEVDQALLVIAKSESRRRWDAVEHLVRAGNAEALELAIAHARSGDSEQRLAAMEALADAGTPTALAAAVALVQGSGELKARALAILGSAQHDDPAVTRLFHEAAHSHVPEEAAAAASALARVGTDDARAALVSALASTDATVAGTAAASLMKFRITDEVTAALRSAVAAHPELKMQVMSQLATAGAPFGLELAKQALAGDDANQAYRALSALEQAGTAGAFDVIAQATRAGDAYVRAEAVATLGTTGDKRAADLLAGALRDTEPGVRAAAARTLGSLGTPRARELLITLTRSADSDDRTAAVASLRRFEDAESQRRLGELVRDPSPSVAYVAIDAVADRANPLATLRGVLADPGVPYELRYRAATQLSYRGYTDPAIDALVAPSE